MRLLLDTHVFIWWVSNPARLSPTVLASFSDPKNEMILSIVSVWELQVKMQLGKLTLGSPLRQVIENQLTEPFFSILPLELTHIYAVGSLQLLHSDPFDRLLIAQAKEEQLTLVTVDATISSYGVQVMW